VDEIWTKQITLGINIPHLHLYLGDLADAFIQSHLH
jgi:hypothetical protein